MTDTLRSLLQEAIDADEVEVDSSLPAGWLARAKAALAEHGPEDDCPVCRILGRDEGAKAEAEKWREILEGLKPIYAACGDDISQVCERIIQAREAMP